jgi:hypothetical protein
MAVHFYQSSQFEEIRSQIELHLYDSVLELEKDPKLAIRSVLQFNQAIDRLMETLEQMYQSLNQKDTLGEKSFPVREGYPFAIKFISSNITSTPTREVICVGS